MASIGGNLESILEQARATTATGETVMGEFVDAKVRARAFTGDVERMASTLEADLASFTDLVTTRSRELQARVEATDWQGRAAVSKHERIAELDATVARFRGQVDGMSADFRAQLVAFIEGFYETIETQVQAGIGDLQAAWDQEATHAQRFAEELEALDRTAAR